MPPDSPYGAATRKAREKRRVLDEGATAIVSRISRKGGNGTHLFMPIYRLAAVLEQAITLDPSVISSNLVAQAAESQAGADRLFTALIEMLDQHDDLDLGDYQIREEPLTEDQMTEAVAAMMTTAYSTAFAATDGSEGSLDPAGLTEAILSCSADMPNPLAPASEVTAYLSSLTGHLDNDPLECGWMGLVIDEDKKIVMRMDRSQIDMQAVQIAAKSTWVHTPTTIHFRSILKPTSRGSRESVSSAFSRGSADSEESEADEEELGTLRSRCDQLQEQVAALEETAEAQRALIADWERKLDAISTKVEKAASQNDRSASEIERLNDRVSGLQINTTATPPTSLPPCLRQFSSAQLEGFAAQIRGGDASVHLKMYEDLGADTCAALIRYANDENQDRTPPPRRGFAPLSPPPPQRQRVASSRANALALEDIVTVNVSRNSRHSRATVMSSRSIISRVTGLSFESKTGKLLGEDGHIIQRADINEGNVEAALLSAAPTLAPHLVGSELGSISKTTATSGSKTLGLTDEGEALLVETLREVVESPREVWMLRPDIEDKMGGSEQHLEMLLGADSDEASRALDFVGSSQALYLGSLDVVKECYRKCVTEQGPDKGEPLFQMILNLIIETVTLHTKTVSGALPKAYAAQHLLDCILEIGCEETYYVNTEHAAMYVRPKGCHRNQRMKLRALLLRLDADLPYESDSDEEKEWSQQEQEDWKKEAETNASIDLKQVAMRERDIKYLNGVLGTAKSKGPTQGQGPGVACLFCSQPATFKGGHKSEDCANLAAFATASGLTGKTKIYAAACEKMRTLNKVLVKELIREKLSLKKLAPALPGGSYFRP